MNHTEQRIWDYIDGTLSPEERKSVEALIASDPLYTSTYQELLQLNSSLTDMELDEPSMGFTRNVMEQVRPLPVPGSIKSLVDKRIILGIAAFFITAITALLVYAISTIQFTEQESAIASTLQIPQINFKMLLNTSALNIFLIVDTIIGLYILDAVLRGNLRKMSEKKLD